MVLWIFAQKPFRGGAYSIQYISSLMIFSIIISTVMRNMFVIVFEWYPLIAMLRVTRWNSIVSNCSWSLSDFLKGREQKQAMAFAFQVGLSSFCLQPTCRFSKLLCYVCMQQTCLEWSNRFYKIMEQQPTPALLWEFVCLFVWLQSGSALSGKIKAASTIFVGHWPDSTLSGFLCYICIFGAFFPSLWVVIRLLSTEGAAPH